MLNRVFSVCALMLIAMPCLSGQATPPAKSQKCSPQDLSGVLKPTDPAYPETVELTRELEDHGYVVRCVLQSKMVNFFEEQLGAALYRTDHGDFEVLLLRKPHTFGSVRVIEQPKNGRFLYLFEGSPRRSSPQPLDCARRNFFARRASQFFVTEDRQLAANLGQVLDSI